MISGNHAVRRFAYHWSGLWSDLAIKQTMILLLLKSGGARED